LLARNVAEVLINAIEHNEIITSTMHFGEAKFTRGLTQIRTQKNSN